MHFNNLWFSLTCSLDRNKRLIIGIIFPPLIISFTYFHVSLSQEKKKDLDEKDDNYKFFKILGIFCQN